MKILTIRGRNLNSLEAAFELDLEAEPFNGAGLFAITGPTGSGKSTLLDTMCLALFDMIPRYQKVTTFKPEENKVPGLSSNDPRNIMRLGSAEAFAEVDFRGVDGHSYRVRWAVRRARNSAEGKIQAQTMSLKDLSTDQELSDTRKTDTMRLIEEKLGLSYDQFCRAVLLAQGDFAAFLKAKPKERAELLEKLTGTDIYSRLSMATFERYKREAERMEEIDRERQSLELLSPEQLAQLQEEIALVEVQVQTLTDRQQSLQQEQQYFRQLAQCIQSVTEAKAQVVADKEKLERLQDSNLEAILAAQPLRPYLKANDDGLRLQQGLLETLQETEAQQTSAQKEQALLAEALETSKAALTQLRTAQAQLSEQLVTARDLDSRLSEKRGQRDKERAQLEQAEAQLRKAESEKDQLAAQLQSTKLERDSLAQRIEAAKDDASLAERWTLYESELAEVPNQLRELDTLKQEVARREKELPAASQRLADQRASLATAQQTRDALIQQEEQLELEAAQFQEEALNKQLQDLAAELKGLERLRHHASEIEKLGQELEELNRLEKALGQNLHEATAQLEAWRESQKDIQIRLEEAQRALKLAEAAQELGQRKAALLHEGLPCPLCGSEEHPWRAIDSPVSQLLVSQEQRVGNLKDQDRRLIKDISNEEAQRQHLEKRLLALPAERAGRQDQIELLQAQQHVEISRLKHQPSDLGLATLEPLWAATQRQEQETRQQQVLAQEARNKAKLASAHAKKARTEHEVAAELAHQSEQAWQTQDYTLKAQRDQLNGQQGRWDERLIKLAPLFALGWFEVELKADPIGFSKRVERRVADWHSLQEEASRIETKLQKSSAEWETAKTTFGIREQELPSLRQTCTLLEVETAALKEKRQALFGGVEAAVVEAGFLTQFRAAERTHEKNLTALQATAQSLETLRERTSQLTRQCLETKTKNEQVGKELNRQLEQAQLSESQLRSFLQHDTPWCDSQRALLDQARQQLASSRTRLEERQTRETEHRASTQPSHSEETLREVLEQGRQELEAAQNTKARCSVRLEANQLNQKKAGQLLPKFEKQQAVTELWEEMNKLIGSKDGTLFRKFAQGLTLDVLIASANSHLAQLEPRYELKRVQSEDLELEVLDRDMAEERRSLAGLSGGETFLVSLALALGLSSLNMATTQIESLFIDEGFGSLDPATLDKALAYLEQLQASGRQVGIISHVAAVAERIGSLVKVTPKGDGCSTLSTVRE